MSKLLSLVILFLFASKPHAQELSGYNGQFKNIPYLVTVPSNYSTDKETSFPLLLFLHGGDRSHTKHHPLKYAKQTGLEFQFIVVAPHCTGGCNWSNVDFKGLINEVQKSHNVNGKQIYITGYSMGGYGTWSAIENYYSLFAAAAPIAGGGNTGRICVANGLSIRAYHGDNDNVIGYKQSVDMIATLKKCGGDAELITIKGGDHGIWPAIFQSQEFYEWLLRHQKS